MKPLISLLAIALVSAMLPPAALEQTSASRTRTDAGAWFLYAGEAARGKLTQETGPGGGPVLGVEALAASTQSWHLILMRPSLSLKEGPAYTLTFLARADRAREIDLQSQISKGDL